MSVGTFTQLRSSAAVRLRTPSLRATLMVIVPALVAVVGLFVYLMGGRYVSTDNAYVGAQKVLITPDISGKITHVAVREGQHVNPGDELFTLDREPYELALQQAKAKLNNARSDYDKLKTNLKSLETLADLAQKNVDLKQRDVERKSKLVSSQAGSQADLDTAQTGVITAKLQAEFATQLITPDAVRPIGPRKHLVGETVLCERARTR